MPFSAGVASSSFKLNTSFDVEYLVVNKGQSSAGLQAGGAGSTYIATKDETTSEYPLSLETGQKLTALPGDTYEPRSNLTIRDSSNSILRTVSPTETATQGNTTVYRKVGSSPNTTVEYVRTNGYNPPADKIARNSVTVTYVPTSNYFNGGAGAGGDASLISLYWKSDFVGTTTETYFAGFNPVTQEPYYGTRTVYLYRWYLQYLRSQTHGDGIESFTGEVVARGGYGGYSFVTQVYNESTGTTLNAGYNSRLSLGAIDAEDNTGSGGSPYITMYYNTNGTRTFNEDDGEGGSGLIQIRYSDTRPLLPNPGTAEYTHYNGYHVYSFKQDATIEI